MSFTFDSLFSGIGGFDLAFERAGMVCRRQVEIDSKCQQVLAHHWPNVERESDVKKAKGLKSVDLVCGGFPCQDLSVAGRRAGLDGERSGLWFEFLRIIEESKPQWVVIENVPGLLSSYSGDDVPSNLQPGQRWQTTEESDLGIIFQGLAKCGYWWAYRVLDAQYWGVPQRRRRVFIVASLGDWRGPAKVLFESESSPWDSAPCRETREKVAAPLKASSPSRRNGGSDPIADEFVTTRALSTRTQRLDSSTQDFVVGCFTGYTGGPDDNKAQAGHIIAFDTTQITSPDNHSNPKPGDPCHTLNSSAHRPALAFDWQSGGDVRLNISDKHTSALQKSQVPAVQEKWGVRRFTPLECERLQGFPDQWTAVKGMSDSAMYKMLGNAVAVPVVRWIGKRIMQVHNNQL